MRPCSASPTVMVSMALRVLLTSSKQPQHSCDGFWPPASLRGCEPRSRSVERICWWWKIFIKVSPWREGGIWWNSDNSKSQKYRLAIENTCFLTTCLDQPLPIMSTRCNGSGPWKKLWVRLAKGRQHILRAVCGQALCIHNQVPALSHNSLGHLSGRANSEFSLKGTQSNWPSSCSWRSPTWTQ